MSTQRLLREWKLYKANSDNDIKLRLDESNLSMWSASILGPRDTPFESRWMELTLKIDLSKYPMVPPTAYFSDTNRIFHPNVDILNGEICLDILKENWSPAWTIYSICRAIIALLANPEPSSPYNCDAANLIRAGDSVGYYSMVQYYLN